MEKESNNDESNFIENQITDLNSLKPFEFEPKTNIVSSGDAEECTEYIIINMDR